MKKRRMWLYAATVLAAFILAAAFATIPATAAPTTAPPKEQITEAQVNALQKRVDDAWAAGDMKTLSSLLADDYAFVHASGQISPKADFLDMAGKMKIDSITAASSRVMPFQGGAVVLRDVTYATTAPSPNGGAPRPVALHILQSNVWTHTSAGWRLLLCQGSFIMPPGGGR